MKNSWVSPVLTAILASLMLGHGLAHAELKGTNATFFSWDDGDDVLRNSNSAIILDGKWHPFFAHLNFDSTAVDPAAVGQSNGQVQCSAVDTDGNGLVGTSTPWAGTLRLSVDHTDTGLTPLVNGFRETRCWELAVCDRENDGTGDEAAGDATALPRYRRFAIDVTQSEGACPTPNTNAEFGWVDPVVTNGFITLLSKDIAAPCDQSGRCDQKIDTDLYIILDRDCDGFIDDNDGAQVNNDPAEGDLSLIGSGGAGRIPLPVGNNDPDVCFFAEGKKPDFTITPQWTGNIQARITAPVGGSGEKTVNHSIIASPTTGDSGDLPVSYATALHVTNAFAGNPFIGGAPDNDTEAFTSPLADADDLDTSNDENGVILPPDTTSDTDGSSAIYTATVTATNNSGVPSMLCGWFDFNQSFTLDNTPNTSTTGDDPNLGSAVDTGERSCVVVPTGTTNGSFSLSWTIAEADRGRSGDFFFRFRISSDEDMFDSILLSHFLGMNSGEVEDYLLQGVSSLPVSIASFQSRMTAEGLKVEWTTVSETHNLGFHIWGTGRDGLELLNSELIPAADSGDALTPRKYSIVLDHDLAERVGELAITAVDYQGNEDMYGLFEAGARYGQDAEFDNIAWQPVQAAKVERENLRDAAGKRGRANGIHNSVHNGKGNSGKQAGPSGPDYADVRVETAGLQAISYEELAAAGLDLGGTPLGSIAVTLKGTPVARDIVNIGHNGGSGQGNAAFGPGHEIRFWADRPELPDALYIEDFHYRISVDPGAVVAAGQQSASARNSITSHLRWDRRDDDVTYNLASPLADPWYAALLRADRTNRYDTQFVLDDGLLKDQPGRVVAVVGGLTDFPENPDHHVVVEVNGQPIGEAMFDGQTVQRLDLEVPAGVLTTGANTVSVLAPGGSGARFDLFMVDTVELGWPSRLQAGDNRILIEQAPANAGGLRVSGLTGADPVAYGRTGGALTSLRARQAGGDVEISALADSASYWVSMPDRIARPGVVATGSNADLLEGRGGDFVIIAHPAFLPLSSSEPHPLNDYLAQRRAEGWQPEVFDVTEIQAQFGHGMALPDAVTAFLAAADQRFSYEHVLLIGADSYDYTDNLGLGSISFIPTRYAATNSIPHTPSDALMADVNGDRVADKAIGRWPVRTPGDLSAIVSKTLDWPGVAADRGIVWVTDSEDSRNGSFVEQADRMIELAADAGWTDDAQSRIYWGEVPVAPGQSVATAAREKLFDTIEQGRALTGFVGHGSPGMWTFQGLLRPNDLKGLYNEGNPTLIGTLTCYTSYFVSPYAESVAHRWMNGYRVDAAGSAIPGVPNGAVAIHGAATLSDYGENEIYARAVLEAQLQGMTLGQAIEAGRNAALHQVMPDLVINWTLLGDPTLRLQP